MIGVHWDDSAFHAYYIHSVYKLGGGLGYKVLHQMVKF